jgi:stage III sporulation protein AG
MGKLQLNDKFKALWLKLKAIKHIEIIIGIIAIAIMLVVYNAFSNSSKTKTTSKDKVSTVNESNEYSYTYTEDRLVKVLQEIEGVGQVQVMINFDGTAEKVAAKTVSTSTVSNTNAQGNSSSNTNRTESPVIISNNGSSSPYILKEIAPKITGIIIVAEGADKPVTKLAIMRACQTILQINASNIEIFTMK